MTGVTMKKVLIAYWSKTGSTQETAELIGNILIQNKFDVVVAPISSCTDIANFDICIIGAPINGMQWVPDATAFVDRNANILSTKKTVLFCLSYIYQTGSSIWHNAIAKTLQPFAEKTNAIETAVFGGRVAEPVPLPMRYIFGIKKESPIDLMNTEEITQWTQDLIPRLF